jgi:hypothetical protein
MAVVSLQFKQNTHNDAMRHRIRSVKIKIPRYLAEEKLDMDDQMAWFLGWIAGSYGDLHIMSDAPSVKAQPMENKYRQLTGKVLSWRLPPPDSTAEEQRYGARAIISFVSINNLPKQLVRYAKVETARTNINHVAFLWALIRFGFDFGQMQNIQKIRLNVPESYRGVFDKGVIGESI